MSEEEVRKGDEAQPFSSRKPESITQQPEISSLSPDELLRLDSINGIPIDDLNKHLKPVREYVAAECDGWGVVPDKDLLDKCTPMDEFPGHVLIDRGLIGPHDEIRQVLALQKAFVDDILKIDNPHQVIAGEMEKILELVSKAKGGSEIIDFKGIAGDKKLVVMRFSSPAPAPSPFQDKDASNVDIRIYDVTGAEKVDAYLLKDCERSGKTIMLSGLQIDFARRYGFYEEAEPLLEYDSLLDGGKAVVQNIHTFLPDGLHILGITNESIDELRSKYKDFQKKYKESPETSQDRSYSDLYLQAVTNSLREAKIACANEIEFTLAQRKLALIGSAENAIALDDKDFLESVIESHKSKFRDIIKTYANQDTKKFDESIKKLESRVDAAIVREFDESSHAYMETSIKEGDDLSLVAQNDQEVELIMEAAKLLNYQVKDNGQYGDGRPRLSFYPPEKHRTFGNLPTTINTRANVGIKNLLDDYASMISIGRPTIRTIIAMVEAEANVFSEPARIIPSLEEEN